MNDVEIRRQGRAGRITLNRPKALNALTWDMCLAIEDALDAWADDSQVALLIVDGAGEKAFCAGGDVAEIHRRGTAGDHDYARRFWRDEYRMNRKLFHFPKPVASFLHGFVMGGGVGVGCHGSHRVVCESTRMAMPEAGIGLVPDVGGTLLLARAPGRVGEYLGVTGDRMDAADAIHAGFADHFVPAAAWEALKARLCETGDGQAIDRAAVPAGPSRLAGWQPQIDAAFGGETLGDIYRGLPAEPPEAVQHALGLMARNSPLSMAVTVQIVHHVRAHDTIENALDREYRYTHRALEKGDFLEGVRAAIIDKDKRPRWRHADWTEVTGKDVLDMTLPLGEAALTFEREAK